MNLRSLQVAAEQYYDPSLPYHNFGHVISTLEKARELIDRCKKECIEIDEGVVICALLFHDAGFIENHTAKGFPTKEHYSADIARREMEKLKISETSIHKVQTAIVETQRDSEPTSIESKIVRVADLSGVAMTYEVFQENAERLRLEHEMLSGEKVEKAVWRKQVSETIETYLSQEISIFKDDRDTESNFHQGARSNLQRYLSSQEN